MPSLQLAMTVAIILGLALLVACWQISRAATKRRDRAMADAMQEDRDAGDDSQAVP